MDPRHSGFAGALGWSLLFAVLTLGLQLGAEGNGLSAQWPFTRTAYERGAWWQLFSAQWVHGSWLHAIANAVGMGVVVCAFVRLVDGRLQALALLGGYLGVALVIALDRHCERYTGASGALHGLLAGCALALLLATQGSVQGARVSRLMGALVLGFLLVKLVWQHPLAGASAPPGWLGLVTYYPAHEAGASGGLLAVALARWRGWFGFAQPPSSQ